jgi:hypothetical protein
LADTQPIAVDRDANDEALLSSAPKPFGTTSHDLAAMRRPKQRNHKWLWASLGLLALVMVAVVTGALWVQRAPRATAEEPQAVPAQPPPVVTEPDAQVADIGTDAPVLAPVVVAQELVVEEAVVEEPVVEEPAVEEVAVEEKAPPKPKAKKKRRSRKVAAPPRPRGEGAGTAAGTETGAETVPGTVPETAAAAGTGGGGEVGNGDGIESDDGIDWTVPDFPEEPEAPTGTPDAPARNPVVIDEPPAQ